MTNKKGFTLVELLVVIGIIGILVTIGGSALNSARQKARDTKRITDIRQMSAMLETEESEKPGAALTGCDAGSYAKGTDDCTGPGVVGSFKDAQTTTNFRDPIKATFADADLCGTVTDKPCAYSITAASKETTAPSTNDYQICFYLEAGVSGLNKGLAKMSKSSAQTLPTLTQGCLGKNN